MPEPYQHTTTSGATSPRARHIIGIGREVVRQRKDGTLFDGSGGREVRLADHVHLRG